MQQTFPDSSRPGPQLFSFEQEDLLGKAWRNEAFEHLKSKWMYIQFHDVNNVGGAVQGVIPVQDADGNILGGSAPASLEEVGSVKSETKAARTEVSRLEQHFEKVMGSVERNTEQITALAERQAGGGGQPVGKSTGASKEKGTGDIDFKALGSHLDRINDMLERNSEHVDSLARRQFENEEKLRVALEENKTRQLAGNVDMSQLSNHLDRIQDLLEKSITERKDSGRQNHELQHSAQADFSPLTHKLGEVQEAMEQNSALIKALLEEGSTSSAPGTPLPLQEKAAPQVDMSPLTSHLENIHKAIERQSTHMQALVGFASGDGDAGSDGDQNQQANQQAPTLAASSEHLEQIYNAVEDGNIHVKNLVEEATTNRIEANSNCENIAAQLDDIRGAVTSRPTFDMALLAEHLEGIRAAAEENAESMRELINAHNANSGDLDIQPLADHLDAMREATDKNSEQLTYLVENGGTATQSGESIDFTPLTERLNRIQDVLEQTHEDSTRDQPTGMGNAKFIMSALSSHLSKIQAVTEQNAVHVVGLREKQSASQDKMQIAITRTAEQLQALAQRAADSEAQRTQLEAKQRASEEKVDRLAQGQREMVTVLRELAGSLKSSSRGECEHVVAPPPRKMGKRVVGFVYEGDDQSSRAGTPGLSGQ